MKVNKGFIFRTGVRIKECGEMMACILLAGIPLLRWACGPVISLGLKIRTWALSSMSIEEL